jgi:hypothetical protein
MGQIHRRVAARRRLWAEESGFGMVSAIVVLFIISVLTATATVIATQISTSTTRDLNVKAEIEAAEAGLQVASYRLGQLKPKEENCITRSEEAKPGAGSKYCAGSGSESLGNGASFQYWTSVALKASDVCGGRLLVASTTLTQRCVTSEGTVSNVHPAVRLQLQVTTPTSGSLFPVNGIFGLESVEISNNVEVHAKGGTNRKFSIGNHGSVEGVALGKSAPAGQPEGKGSPGPVTREATDFVLAKVNPGNSASENSDSRIEAGSDPSKGVTYNKETRTVETSNGAELTLGGEVYNFCNFTTGNNAKITLAAGKTTPTKIFIDSGKRSGSKCAAESGKLAISNNTEVINPTNDPTMLQIYVYDESGGTVLIANNSTFYGTIYAPLSVVEMKNNGEFVGAVAASSVSVRNNGGFRSDKRVESLRGSTGTVYQRAAWEQCTTGSGASEGC